MNSIETVSINSYQECFYPHLVQKVCKVCVWTLLCWAPGLQAAVVGHGPCVDCTYWHTGHWSGGCLSLSRQHSPLSQHWPVATPALALYHHTSRDSRPSSNTLTHFTSKNHMIIDDLLSWIMMEYHPSEKEPIFVNKKQTGHCSAIRSFSRPRLISGHVGWASVWPGLAGAWIQGSLAGHTGIQRESTLVIQGASHAIFVSRQTMNPSYCQNIILQPTEASCHSS